MKINKKIATASFVAIGMALGIGAVAFADTKIKPLFNDSNHEKVAEFVKPDYEVNENGETYGSAMGVCPEDSPVLTAVVGDNGNRGYARTEDLMGEMPSSPEEALRIQEERIKSGDTKRVVNVYEKDGITIIDTFTMELSGYSVDKE
ncbi:MAG: hypothetical protein FWG83_02310 [Oscillospiraceae bacterium]|nr:hypothetical protein [Oscillospiraceae bacterium]